MSATSDVIGELYRTRPPERWEDDVVDIPGTRDLVPHNYRTARLLIHQTNLVRDAIGLQLVITTVPDEFRDQVRERPSAIARVEAMLIPRQIAEINDDAERDPVLMRRNVREFLAQGRNWQEVLGRHVAASREELLVLLGRRPAPEAPRRRWWSPADVYAWARLKLSATVSDIDRERNNIETHWLMEVFFRGAAPHFYASHENAREDELREDADAAALLATALADTHLAAGQLAGQKLRVHRGEEVE